MNYPKIFLKPGKEQSIKRFHPWIFSGAIKRIEGTVEEGDIIEIFSNTGDYLATGHYQPSSISVRIFSFKHEKIDTNFWRDKLQNALYLRQVLGLYQSKHTNIFRLVHGEGDGLPGLVIDIYGATAVIQCHSLGMFKIREELAKLLLDIFEGNLKSVYDKSSAALPFKSGVATNDGYIIGGEVSDKLLENNLRFKISWVEGQKTGFFIDQRENRLLLQYLSKDKTVLNAFGYTGGFSVYAIEGGASKVVTVDSSEKAIEMTNQNVAMNFKGISHHTSVCDDVFEYLRKADEKYDIIVLDPPAFAKHNDALRNALQAYKRLNAAAIQKINPGGVLFTFSCSQVVNKVDFRNAVFSGCAITGRQVKILHQLTQPADHPINIYHPEGEYLKGLVLQVE